MKSKVKNMNCWILTHARSGSTYLCDLLNSTGGLPYFSETLHPYPDQSHMSRDDFFQKSLGFGKIHRSHFDLCLRDSDKLHIKQHLPDLKFVLLRRNNHNQVAVSLYLAKMTNCWNILKKEEHGVQAYLNTRVDIDNTMLLQTLNECRRDYYGWDEFLKNETFLDLSFEELIQFPQAVVAKVFSFLNVPQCIIRPDLLEYIHPMPTHPQKTEIADLLKKGQDSGVV